MPVHEDPELADALAALALGQEVPEELWTAVAEVLAWAYAARATRRLPRMGDQGMGSAARYRPRPSGPAPLSL